MEKIKKSEFKLKILIISLVCNFIFIFLIKNKLPDCSYGFPYEVININIDRGSGVQSKYILEMLFGEYINMSINPINLIINIFIWYIVIIICYKIFYLALCKRTV